MKKIILVAAWMMNHSGTNEEVGRPVGAVGIIQGVVMSGTRVLVVEIVWRQISWTWSVRDRE